MGRDEIVDRLRGRRQDLSRLGVRSVSLFGSVARGEEQPDSDIDLLLEFDGPPTFDQYMDARFFLEDLLGTTVDVVTLGALRPRLRPIVEREAIRVA